MTSPLVPAIQGASGQPATVRVGRIVQTEPTVVVAVQGTEFNNVGWIGAYLPDLGDSVILLGQSPASGPDQGSWVALGATSATPSKQVHIAKLQRTTVQSIPPGGVEAIEWNTVIVDTMGGFDSGTPGEYVVPFDGYYQLDGHASFVVNATGQRQGEWYINHASTETQVSMNAVAVLGTRFALQTYTPLLAAGDVIEMTVFQNTAGNLNTETTAGTLPNMTIRYLGQVVG